MPTQPLSPLEQQQQARVSTITSPPPDEPRRRKRRKKRRKKKPTLLEQLYNYVSSAGGACFGQAPPDKKEKSKKREPRFERGVSFLELFDRITKDRTQVKTVDAAVYAQQMLSSIEYLHAQAIVVPDERRRLASKSFRGGQPVGAES